MPKKYGNILSRPRLHEEAVKSGFCRRDSNETADNIEEGDLIIRDPGYFATAVLAKTAEKKAYFLSRVTAGTSIYNKP